YIDLVYGSALKMPDATAVVCGGDRLTFREVHERAGHLGAAFRARGLVAGDRIAWLADNELQYIELQAACLRSGFTFVPLNTRLTDPELEYLIRDSDPALFIGGKNYADTIKRIGESCDVDKLISTAENDVVGSYKKLLNSAEPDPDADPTDSDLNALILYTSGTTSHPKGAMIDRMAFSARVIGNAMELEIGQDEVLLQNLPLFHISSFLFCAYFFRGATCALLPNFDPEAALDLMQRAAVTATNGVPTVIAMLLEAPNIDAYDPAPLRLITYGGAPIEPSLLRKAIAKFACGFQQHYGMTEAGSACLLKAEDHDPDDTDALTSAGCDAAGYELRIIDENGTPLPNGEAGEIILRGAGLMTGYWRLPEKTAESLVNGWFHTGDIGYRDERNFLHVIDRRNDMIISGGENIYPREIEAALGEHPAMPDVAIIGLPDPKWGEVVSCVLREDAPAEEDLEAWLRGRIAGYKIPRRWFRVTELPRNATGKVLKVQLRKQFGKGN
ncbi:MAG: AMP-binding protein, partial [Deltaproteobacteria bacterium]|nr:AMP-binding protein [Deltaproteobacteria bacterium]